MNKKPILLAAALLAVPSAAYANVGTPLMWALGFHLLLGNFLLGVFEGLLLAKIFSLPKGKCVALLVIANYLSAWFGGYGIARAIADLLPFTLNNVAWLLALLAAITYALTLLICLYDPIGNRIALLARGHGPVAVIK